MFKSVRHTNVAQQVIDQIRDAILKGKLRPGDKLPTEMELVQRFEVSKQVLREALRALQYLGLIQIRKGINGGAFVAEVPEAGVVGWVHVFASQRLMIDAFAEVGGLVVDHAWTVQGIGGALLQHAEAWASQHGLKAMRIRSNTIRQAAHRFYIQKGYTPSKMQSIFLKILHPPPHSPPKP